MKSSFVPRCYPINFQEYYTIITKNGMFNFFVLAEISLTPLMK